MSSQPNTIVDHIDELLPRLISLATYQKDMVEKKIQLKFNKIKFYLFF